MIWLLLIVLALAILIPFCQITFQTARAWILADIAGCGLFFLVKYVFQLHKFKLLKSHGTIAKIIKVDFDGRQLDWSLDEEKVKHYIKSGWGIILSFVIILAIGALTLIPLYFYYNDYFRGLKIYDDHVSPTVGLVWSYILSGIVFIITIAIYAPIVIEDSIKIGTDDADRDFLRELATQTELAVKVLSEQFEKGIVSMTKMLPKKNE